MMLYEKKLTNETKISDVRGRELKALTVLSQAITYFKDHLLKSLEHKGLIVEERGIRWVLTVPAIWDDMAKMFMRTAAQQAGIPIHQLVIALEPEAASIFCKYLPIERLEGSNSTSTFQPGSKYLVLDAGDGTVDITVHEVKENGHLKELHCASGGGWGGTNVDMTFEQALAEIVAEGMMESYCHKYPVDYIELLRDFENKKRKCGINNDSSQLITLNVPVTFIEECFETLGEDLTTLSSKSRFNNHLFWKSNKVRIDKPTFEGFFQPAFNEIINHVRELLKSPRVKSVKKILMVGGFSESSLLQDAIRKTFPDCQVIVPQEAGLAFLRGAVIFGCIPKSIESRVAKYTYGVRMNEQFDPKKHKESKKEVIDGVEYSMDIFDRHVQKGQLLIDDEFQVEMPYAPVTVEQRHVSFNIFISMEDAPLYVDSCNCIGKFSVALPKGNEKDRSVTVKMSFGKTELTAEATVTKTGEIIDGVFDLPD